MTRAGKAASTGTAQPDSRPRVLPYSAVVGQRRLCQALELAYVNPAVGGVLIAGPRGSAKSTAVRAFAVMVSDHLPITLPLGATEDRVIGGWDIEMLVKGKAKPMDGLLQQASLSRSGILYVDEVNLLDDHIVDLLLDAAASGILHAEREGLTSIDDVHFTLIGTMNPDEGGLRPQLMDRFGLVASAQEQNTEEERAKIIQNAMLFGEFGRDPKSPFMRESADEDRRVRARLSAARRTLPDVTWSDDIVVACAKLATKLEVVGHRGPLALLNAARAQAALEQQDSTQGSKPPAVTLAHLTEAAEFALIHRRARSQSDTMPTWTDEDDKLVADALAA